MPNSVHVADTVPYAWPYDGVLAVDELVLLICGAQHQLIAVAHDALDVGERLAVAARAVRAGGGRVVWVRHGGARSRGGPPQFLPTNGTDGWELAAEPQPADLVIDCAGWDGCYGSALDHELRSHGCRTVVLGGFASEVTVDSTVRTLNDQGYECLVLSDGCAPLDLHLGARAHHSLTMSGGIFGALGTTTSLLDALHRDTSGNPPPTTKETPA